MVGRKLADSEMNANGESLADPSTREPLWRSDEIPIGGEPAEVHEIISTFAAELRESDLPKLLLHVDPGVIITPLEPVDIWPGIPFLQDGPPTLDRL